MIDQIGMKLDKEFVETVNELERRYGEEFTKLNGLHEQNLNFSDFIDHFIDSDNVANATIDANANANSKDICSLMAEINKPHTKLLAFNKIFYELRKKYGADTAKRWLELEWNGAFYLHDAYSASFKPYSYAPTEMITVSYGTENNLITFEQLYDYVDTEEKYDEQYDMYVKVPQGLYVLDRDGFSEIKRVIKHYNHKKMIYILASLGNYEWDVIVTCDHPVITKRGDIPADQVTLADYVEVLDPSDGEWKWVQITKIETSVDCPMVYDITTSTGHFVCNDIVSHNCFAYTLEDLATKGLFFVPGLNSEAPQHLTTFCRDILEFVSWCSNRTSGRYTCPFVSFPFINGVAYCG